MFLVTGGSGFVGSHLLGKLRARNLPVRSLGRRNGRREGLPPGVEVAHADWRSGEGIESALEGVDTVIHLAGVTKALKSADYYQGNAGATETLARLLAGRPIRFVHVSSLAAVGPSPDGKPLTEDAVPRPFTHYGKSKLEAERQAAQWRPDAVIVRPPVVYGPRDTDVFQILKSIAAGWSVEIGGGEHWFSAIYVEDLAEGLIAAAQAPEACGKTYFLSHPKVVSWSELGLVAARILRGPGRPPHVLRIPPRLAWAGGLAAELWSRITRKPGIVSRDKVAEACCRAWTCDSSRAARELGFQAATPLETGLTKTLAWCKEAGWIRN